MINIRRGSFETNSSSMHSLVISNKVKPYTDSELKFDYALKNEKGTDELFFDLWRYCSEDELTYERSPFQVLRTPLDKLRYYVAANVGTCSKGYNKEEKKKVTNFIMKQTGITNPNNICLYKEEERWGNSSPRKVKNYGAVYCNDCGETPMHFMDRKGISLEDLILNPKYTIVVDGDESQLFKGLFDSGVISAEDIEDISSGIDFWTDAVNENSFYLINRNIELDGLEKTIEDILNDLYDYQHTFEIRFDPFDEDELKFGYNVSQLKEVLDSVKSKYPNIKTRIRFYTYTKNCITEEVVNKYNTSIFDSVIIGDRYSDWGE